MQTSLLETLPENAPDMAEEAAIENDTDAEASATEESSFMPGLPLGIQKAITAQGYTDPTPIQMMTIPVGLAGGDVLGIAQTGSGKTAAFAIPMIVRILNKSARRALVLAPTRELADQIVAEVRKLTRYAPGVRATLVVGGASMHKQRTDLKRNPEIVIATPGRLMDHIRQGTVKLHDFDIAVLDEVDRMLDIGFEPQLRSIFQTLPKERQTYFFSATLPSRIRSLVNKYSRGPKEIRVEEGQAGGEKVSFIAQSLRKVAQRDKANLLLDELNAREGSVIVFLRTKHRTDRVCDHLESYGHSVTRIHGNRSPAQRQAAMNGFRNGKFRVLVATDIVARGIDVSHVAHVINFDIPNIPEDYVHRIGRTGRAGRSGEALSFLTPEDAASWKEIQRLLKKKGAADVKELTSPPVKGAALATKKMEAEVHALPEEAEDERPKRAPRKEFKREDSGSKRPPRRDFGDKPRFDDRGPPRRSFGDRPSFGDKPRFDDRGPPRRSFGDRPSFGDKPRFDDRGPPRRSFGDRPSFGDKPRFDDRGPPRRSFGDRPSFGDKPRFDDRGPPRRSFGDRPSFGDKPRFGDRDRPQGGARGGKVFRSASELFRGSDRAKKFSDSRGGSAWKPRPFTAQRSEKSGEFRTRKGPGFARKSRES